MTKEARIYKGKRTVSSVSGAEKTWIATSKRMKLQHYLTLYTKTNSKWIKDLSVRQDTIKLLEENIIRTLFDISHRIFFFDSSPREMKVKTKNETT